MRNPLPLIFLCIIIAACTKSKDKQPSNTELITSSSWKYQSGGIDQDRNGSIDITFASTGLLKPCMLDNTGSFHSDGTGISDEGATKCDTAAAQTSAFTWTFQNNETALSITGSSLFGAGGQFNIQSLTAQSMGLQKDTTIYGTTVSMIVNLSH